MADDPQKDPNAPETPPRLNPTQLLAKHGDWEAAARALAYQVDEVERDAAGYRAKIRDLKALVPADGSRVLTPEQAATLDAFTADLVAAGLDTSDKLRAHLATAQADAAAVAQAARAADLARVAEAAGVSAAALPDVFTAGETFEVEGEGDARTVYVRPAAADGQTAERVPFETYVDTHKAALKPALYAEGQQHQQPATPGVRFVEQPAAGRPPVRRSQTTEEAAANLVSAFAI